MIDSANFIVRRSGRKEGYYYIDYFGQYKITDISKEVKIKSSKLTEIYLENGGIIDNSFEVYYFDDFLKAKKAIAEITSKITPVNKGKNILFTEALRTSKVLMLKRKNRKTTLSHLHFKN